VLILTNKENHALSIYKLSV